MITLGKHRNYRNAKTKRQFKPFDTSLTRFQNFLQKSQTNNFRSTSKKLTPNKNKMEKLNFSNTANSTSFLPPKSIDKYRFSATNRGSVSFKDQFIKIQTQTPSKKSSFFNENQQQEFKSNHRQMKAKIENNAMQRFQELFKRQTNVRSKRIEEQQSIRLMCLLEHTSRKKGGNQKQEDSFKPVQPYFSSVKRNQKKVETQKQQQSRNQDIKIAKNLISELSGKLKSIEDNSKNEKVSKQNNVTIQVEEKKKMNFEIKRKNSFMRQKQTIQQKNQKKQELPSFQKVQQQKKNVHIVQSLKNQDNKTIQKPILQDKFIEKQQVKMKQNLMEKVDEHLNLLKQKTFEKQIYSSRQTKQRVNLNTSQQKQKPQNQHTNANKEQNPIQSVEKNSLQLNNYQIEEIKTVQLQQKQIIKDNSQPFVINKQGNPLSDRFQAKKQPINENIMLQKKDKKVQDLKSIKGVNAKQSITIKSSRDMRGSVQQKGKTKIERYQQDDDLDLDVVQIGYNYKVQQKKNIEEKNVEKKNLEEKNSKNNENRGKNDEKGEKSKQEQKRQQINQKQKVSATSLADQVSRMGRDMVQSSRTDKDKVMQDSKGNIDSKKKIENKERQQQKVETQRQGQDQQEQQLQPADELDYLICLVQNLGRYYNKSKQFYSATESSMVQIVMNHKLASYYVSQQFYYYLNFFISHLQQQKSQPYTKNITQFYTLTPQQLSQALQDQTIQQAIEDLKNSLEVAKKLIKHTHQKAKIYLKKNQKQLQINPILNFHSNCLQHVKQEFNGLYTLYQQRKSKTLAERLCYLIEIFSILKSLNGQDSKQFEDLEDIGEENYHQHLMEHKKLLEQK